MYFSVSFFIDPLLPSDARTKEDLKAARHVLTKDADSADSARPLHYSKSDSRLARAPVLSPCYSLTHAHRFIGHRNRNPQPLADSPARLMYLRVYDSRDSSRQEIALVSLHPPRPYATRSHMHTGPLVIAIVTPSFWLIPPRD